MKFFTFLTVIGTVIAAPLIATPRVHTPLLRRAVSVNPPSFTFRDVWQLALYIEHLEIGLYFTAFARFSEQDFINAGFDAFYYQSLRDILHEHQYQAQWIRDNFISRNEPAVLACRYSFPFTDIKSFIELSIVLESFATSFYLSAAYSVVIAPDPDTLLEFAVATAGSTAAIDAKHVAFQRLSLKQNVTDTNYFPPLRLNESYTFANTFARSCPQSRYTLPFTLLPTLTPNVTQVQPGQVVDFYSSLPIGNSLNGLFIYDNSYSASTILTTGDKPGHFHTTIPSEAAGQLYFVVTLHDENGFLDETSVVAGPGVLEAGSPKVKS